MKKYVYLIIIVLVSSLVLTGCLLSNVGQVPTTSQTKVKPTGNTAGAEEVPWNLSGAVMPVPPWGLSDIPGSNTASKLIVNQPNGNVEVAVTGVMKGLNPNTVYTVFPSKAWSTSDKWNIVGDWSLRFMYGGAYDHDMTVTFQNMHTGVFSGTGHNSHTWDILGTSEVVGDNIYLDIKYQGSTYEVYAVGTINVAGSIVDGTWNSNVGQSGTWSSYAGMATILHDVGNGYPGLLPGQQTFTFLTDEDGAGSWHFNLKNDDFPVSGTYDLSVWINKPGATILISDNFQVEVE